MAPEAVMVGGKRCGYHRLGVAALRLGHSWEVAAWENAQFGTYLEVATWKNILRKVPLGKKNLGKYSYPQILLDKDHK